MPHTELPLQERVILDINARDATKVDQLTQAASISNIQWVKYGAPTLAAVGTETCGNIAADHRRQWIADARLHDDSAIMVDTLAAYKEWAHPPEAITVHSLAGRSAMQAVQENAGTTSIFGLTHAVTASEAAILFRDRSSRVAELLIQTIVSAGFAGVIARPPEVAVAKAYGGYPDFLGIATLSLPSVDETFDPEAYATQAVSAMQRGADRVIINTPTVEVGAMVPALDELLNHIASANEA